MKLQKNQQKMKEINEKKTTIIIILCAKLNVHCVQFLFRISHNKNWLGIKENHTHTHTTFININTRNVK